MLLVLVINPSGAQADEFNPDALCPLIENGTRIKDPRYCDVYIICMNDTSVSGSCGDQFYDRNTGTCVDPATITCLSSDPCAKKGNGQGFVADPYSCNGYYYCSNGVGTRGTCSDGMNYNPDTNNCVRNYPCEITMLPEDYCNIVPEGVFIKVPGSCSAYETCWHSQLLNGTCPSGFDFDAFRGGCDYPQNVQCDDYKEPDPAPEDVKCTVDGVFISDGLTCDGYYYCEENGDGQFDMIHGTCPVDRFFDPTDGGQCLPRTSIVCEYNRCVTLGQDFIQLANIDGDGCTGFSICQYGKEIARGQCPSGLYFDEMSQLCVSQMVTYAACSNSTTTASTSGQSDTTSQTETSTLTPAMSTNSAV